MLIRDFKFGYSNISIPIIGSLLICRCLVTEHRIDISLLFSILFHFIFLLSFLFIQPNVPFDTGSKERSENGENKKIGHPNNWFTSGDRKKYIEPTLLG